MPQQTSICRGIFIIFSRGDIN